MIGSLRQGQRAAGLYDAGSAEGEREVLHSVGAAVERCFCGMLHVAASQCCLTATTPRKGTPELTNTIFSSMEDLTQAATNGVPDPRPLMLDQISLPSRALMPLNPKTTKAWTDTHDLLPDVLSD